MQVQWKREESEVGERERRPEEESWREDSSCKSLLVVLEDIYD